MALTQDDWLVFTTKTQDLERACADWAWLPVQGDGPARTASGLPVLTPQNGMAAERIALRWFGQVYGASVNTPARYTELGQIVVGGNPEPGLMVVGRFPQGEIVWLGRLHGVATPFNQAIQQAIGQLCQSGSAQGGAHKGVCLGRIEQLVSSARELAAGAGASELAVEQTLPTINKNP